MSAPLVNFATSSLRLFTRVPDDHHAVKVIRHYPGTPYAKGMYVIVDPSDTELVDSADYAIQWDEHLPVTLTGLRLRKDRWFVGPIGGSHSVVGTGSAVTLIDGPYREEGLRKKLVGRVVGYLGGEDGRPLAELWEAQDHLPPETKVLEARDLPDVYAMTCVGKCLEPVYADGTKFSFSIADEVNAGDYVVLWRKPNYTRRGQIQALLKRLMTPIPASWDPALENLPISPVVIVETHNPPRSWVVRLDELMAIHKCNGEATLPTYKVSREEGRAIAEQQRAARSAA